ncbi:uncharacterized protein BDZ99DRAFT_467803 [Mytilinidion resinicola]|uniref:Uncharacterized protein n=1 Tax=Mytilinidion resinicola TaxID=574789 RepID=A0A6A6Y818_9PEZI|nr:uncharacterized protein BDZ99DRAFT_467803 [Mytilinidion resinicola]KAF2804114.1 hypothetical protein BDZ99DRAFT_467803 [Mytilinidion resinicola]
MSGEGDSSGGGGYNKYSCCYRIEFNCPEFVWQNGDACGACLAKGRPSKRETE